MYTDIYALIYRQQLNYELVISKRMLDGAEWGMNYYLEEIESTYIFSEVLSTCPKIWLSMHL